MKRLVSQYAEEWNCWIVEDSQVEVYREARDAIMQACEKHARDPNTLRKTATIGVDLPGFESQSPDEERIQGSLGEITEELGRFVQEDVDHLSVWLRPLAAVRQGQGTVAAHQGRRTLPLASTSNRRQLPTLSHTGPRSAPRYSSAPAHRVGSWDPRTRYGS